MPISNAVSDRRQVPVRAGLEAPSQVGSAAGDDVPLRCPVCQSIVVFRMERRLVSLLTLQQKEEITNELHRIEKTDYAAQLRRGQFEQQQKGNLAVEAFLLDVAFDALVFAVVGKETSDHYLANIFGILSANANDPIVSRGLRCSLGPASPQDLLSLIQQTDRSLDIRADLQKLRCQPPSLNNLDVGGVFRMLCYKGIAGPQFVIQNSNFVSDRVRRWYCSSESQSRALANSQQIPSCPHKKGIGDGFHSRMLSFATQFNIGEWIKTGNFKEIKVNRGQKTIWLDSMSSQGFLESNNKPTRGRAYKVVRPFLKPRI